MPQYLIARIADCDFHDFSFAFLTLNSQYLIARIADCDFLTGASLLKWSSAQYLIARIADCDQNRPSALNNLGYSISYCTHSGLRLYIT